MFVKELQKIKPGVKDPKYGIALQVLGTIGALSVPQTPKRKRELEKDLKRKLEIFFGQ